MLSTSRFAGVFCLLACFIVTSHLEVCGDTIAQFTFDNTDNPTENTGSGPDGALLGGASVSDGKLMVNGPDQGLDIPLGAMNPFGGDTDWNVSFDFATSGNPTSGVMFSSDGSFEPFPGEQTGVVNIYLAGEGNVLMDFWWVGSIVSENTYNDDQMHEVEASYTAATGVATLTVDGTDTVMAEGWGYSRDATGDRTRVGDETNGDFGTEINPGGFFGYFDNVVIEGVPEPSSILLLLIGVVPLLYRRSRRTS